MKLYITPERKDFMSSILTRNAVRQVLEMAVSTGADFAEVYAEHTKSNRMTMIDGKVETIIDNFLSGAGIRVCKGLKSVYACTGDLSLSGLLKCAANAAQAIASGSASREIVLTERIFGDIHPVKIVPGTAPNARKADIIRTSYAAAREYHEDISQVESNLIDVDHEILIANSDGLFTGDRQVRTRLFTSAVASKNGENQAGSCSPGRRMGLEMFDTIDPAAVGREAARQAVVMLSAGYCPAGKMTVAIENGFGGVIFHEACGHSLEATAVAKGRSQFVGKLGTQIANPKVTAIDDGTIPGAWGSMNIDDEGHPSQRNVLIENGVLKSYLIDRLNGKRMGMASTGSSRRQSYTFEPTSRMTNTYIANGPDKNEDILRSMNEGLYCRKMGGGSVNPITGEFNFAVTEGYLVRNGQICEPVRGATLIGKGSEILMDIDMVGQNLDMGQGMCGSASGSIPTNVGQPLIRVSSITVGGR